MKISITKKIIYKQKEEKLIKCFRKIAGLTKKKNQKFFDKSNIDDDSLKNGNIQKKNSVKFPKNNKNMQGIKSLKKNLKIDIDEIENS